MALVYTPEGQIGQRCPAFRLPSVQGGDFDSQSLPENRPFLVMFICNHCPYVKAIEDRLIQLGQDCAAWKIPVIAISSNDPEDYPEDSFEMLGQRAREKAYPFIYLFDESQEVARAFGAVCTPDFFLYDSSRSLVYRGRLDDSWKNPERVQKQELREAIERVLQQAAPIPASEQIPSMGCSIKWKE